MPDWSTYTLSDFLLFTPQTYYRLYALYNAAIWPAQLFALALGIAILALVRRGGAWSGRVVTAILALCWLWVAEAYFVGRYASINWAAVYFAGGFAIEALLLVWMGVIRAEVRFSLPRRGAERAALGLYLFALLVQPLIGPLAGRAWRQIEIFGVAPDPTVAATLGLLLLSGARRPWLLLPIPILWCAISGATAWALDSPDAVVMPAVAMLSVVLLGAKRA